MIRAFAGAWRHERTFSLPFRQGSVPQSPIRHATALISRASAQKIAVTVARATRRPMVAPATRRPSDRLAAPPLETDLGYA